MIETGPDGTEIHCDKEIEKLQQWSQGCGKAVKVVHVTLIAYAGTGLDFGCSIFDPVSC